MRARIQVAMALAVLGFSVSAAAQNAEPAKAAQGGPRKDPKGIKGISPFGQNASLKAKILFVLADVKERQRSWEEETNGWNAYEAHAKAAPTAKTYPQTPPDRKKRITDWKQLEVDSGAVKERIKVRLEEANKRGAADAQSKGNR